MVYRLAHFDVLGLQLGLVRREVYLAMPNDQLRRRVLRRLWQSLVEMGNSPKHLFVNGLFVHVLRIELFLEVIWVTSLVDKRIF